MRRRSCKICKQKFQPANSNQLVCSINCAREYGRNDIAARRKKQAKRRKAEARPLAKIKQEAQQAFNKFIRLRDTHLPCISCGRFHQGQYHAGHYRSVGACPELRFEEMNCHKQCAPCNNHRSGDIINYRQNLILRYGANLVEWLEGKHAPKNYTRTDYEDIKKQYRAKCREIERQEAA